MGDDDREVVGAGRAEEISSIDAWVFDALDLASDPNSIARMTAILDEVGQSRGGPGEAGLRISAEFTATPARALHTVLWWLTTRRAEAGERAVKELLFHADLRSRLVVEQDRAGVETVADLDAATLHRALEDAAAEAGISIDVAQTIFENGPEASAAF